MRILVLLAALALSVSSSVDAWAHEEHLEGTEWGVVGEDGPSARFVSFAGTGRLFGFGGCNRLSGSYEQHEAHLTISPLAMTKMACAPDVMAKEKDFLDMLTKVRGVRVDHTLLLFLDEAGGDLKALTRRNAEPADSSSE